ncbi:MAG: hypothetical protein QM796_11030 [Chthoniobacteraceae bacterium]
MPIRWDQYRDHEKKVTTDEEGEMVSDAGLISASGLGVCIGVCIAYGKWAWIGHHSMSEQNLDGYERMIVRAKEIIPPKVFSTIRPILAGSDPNESSKKDWQKSRAWSIRILKNAGLGKPHLHWCKGNETAEINVCLLDKIIEVEVGGDVTEYAIPQPPSHGAKAFD